MIGKLLRASLESTIPASIFILTSNISMSIAWYTDVLGFKILNNNEFGRQDENIAFEAIVLEGPLQSIYLLDIESEINRTFNHMHHIIEPIAILTQNRLDTIRKSLSEKHSAKNASAIIDDLDLFLFVSDPNGNRFQIYDLNDSDSSILNIYGFSAWLNLYSAFNIYNIVYVSYNNISRKIVRTFITDSLGLVRKSEGAIQTKKKDQIISDAKVKVESLHFLNLIQALQNQLSFLEKAENVDYLDGASVDFWITINGKSLSFSFTTSECNNSDLIITRLLKML